MKYSWFPLLLIFVLSSSCFGAKIENSIIVNGNGSVMVEPDSASVGLGVEVLKATAQTAQTSNAQIMSRVIAAIEGLGIKREKIQTTGYNIWPEMKYEQNQPPKIVGYRCSNQVNVTIEDLKSVSKIIDTAIYAGANNVQRMQFSRKNDLGPKKRAFEIAVEEASEKASAIAAASGLKIKKIDTIVESGQIQMADSGALRAMDSFSSSAQTPISSGLIEIKAGVTITYKID